MKIAVLADIHGNLAALHAAIDDIEAWSPDMVVVAGDIVNRGPESGACLDLLLRMRAERGWRLIRGNHERYVLTYEQNRRRPDFPSSGPSYELSRMTRWSHSQLSSRLEIIRELPEQLQIDLGGETLAVYHASLRHDRDGISAESPDEELRAQIDGAAALFCVGHTHVPLVRRLGGTLLVNVGSVGLPFDGDTRAAYARLTRRRGGWQAQITRVPYDVAATARVFVESGMLEAVGAHAHIMLRELQTGRSLLFDFVPAYHGRVQAGAISLDEAVREYLGDRSLAA
jgi:putative phosphoesterase